MSSNPILAIDFSDDSAGAMDDTGSLLSMTSDIEKGESYSTCSMAQDGESSEMMDNSQSDDEEDPTEKKLSPATSEARRNGNRNNGGKMVYVVLAFTAIAFALVTYFLLSSSQEKEFQSEFQSYARETADIAENNAENTFGQLRTLATAITSIAMDSNRYGGFPNVTIPHFDLRAQEIAELTGAEMILFVPFVEEQHRLGWEQYAIENQGWIEQDYDYRGWDASNVDPISENLYNCSWCGAINDTRRGFVDENEFMEAILQNLTYKSEDFHAPIAQYGPATVDSSLAMMDLFTHPIFKKEIVASLEYDVPVISETIDLDFLLRHIQQNNTQGNEELRSFTLDQVKEDFRANSKTIGYVIGVVPWNTFFANLLPETVNGIVVQVESDCGKSFTYTINGGKQDTAAEGALHDSKYDDMAFRSKFFWKEHPKGKSRHCHFDLVIYPSDEFHALYRSNEPLIYGALVLGVFAVTAVIFFLYHMVMSKSKQKVMIQAARAEALVNSVFPEGFGERLMADAEDQKMKSNSWSAKGKLSHFLISGDDGATNNDNTMMSKPLADLFTATTIMFADIVGFTAWSSTREPSQVFTLLESIYREFDLISKRRRVFKVETVGDCYVAVAGLPMPRRDHFIAMARVASDCLTKMDILLRQLEVQLGPDTTDLGIRIGLHSGPVTAGVLRGERARFQLFGDTVNTTARIESTGAKNKIHISKETADLLDAAGKGHWCIPREDKVVAKGKGELQTYWLNNIRSGDSKSVVSAISSSANQSGRPRKERHNSSRFSDTATKSTNGATSTKKFERLIDWNCECLHTLLKQIVERRRLSGVRTESVETMKTLETKLAIDHSNKVVLDEVVEIVKIPKFNAKTADSQQTTDPVELDPKVYAQLRNYVSAIASMYNDNFFHNFEHASHVTSSVMKLLNRIVAPDIRSDDARDLHDHTYGITSDPLTQFAVVFSAMLHDVDHMGVPNTTLVEEEQEVAKMYKNQSVAEQNSVDIAWGLLMEDNFQELRRAIYSNEAEFKRFRQLVVNTVMATDIMDKNLKALRNNRWDTAFSQTASQKDNSKTNNRKATIVIEHLIQASDVAHTMQHWQVYRKWNGRLFKEMYKAYQDGRTTTDPSENWYKGEIGFFDFYIIPLAKKLDECGVFGVSSHEYLNYAQQNRNEWELKGQAIVEELKEMVTVSTQKSGLVRVDSLAFIQDAD